MSQQEQHRIFAGIDTHADTHHVAIITDYGKPIADREFLATSSGYRKAVDFITAHGIPGGVGVEGTGTYGAGLTKALQQAGIPVTEVNRPNRQQRHMRGKSDPLDAYQAAQSVLAGISTAVPKAKDGPVECLRVLRTSRASAIKSRTATINQIRDMLVSAEDSIRAKYRGMPTVPMIAMMAKSRPTGHLADPVYVIARVLKTLALRYQYLTAEIEEANESLQELLDSYAPLLCDLPGVGTDVASQLLVTMGDNKERISNEAQFAALAGVAPVPASSGKSTRFRLSRGGDRQANSALHHIVLVRMGSDARTKDYVDKRTAEGKSKREIMRCLKRYVAREVYRQITNPIPAPTVTDLRLRRRELGITLQQVAEHLNHWPSYLSRLERGRTRNDLLSIKYRSWLAEQAPAAV
ncbi:IS110 family transposase [Arthrobacter sp. B1805]|uniref:IS110 family transposase n=1 Tax=Arthrobacter sp. B1805 TaxID=2058892 RepID=UPI000CE4DD19|nr:IS110 family transposase [Arthrobacter sp. B1805]